MDLTNNKDGRFLYKYLPFNQYSIQLIIHQEFWLGPPDLLNDPFEGDFIIKNLKELHNEEFVKILLKLTKSEKYSNPFDYDFRKTMEQYNVFENRLYEYLNNSVKKTFGTTSFSMNCNSLKMWSHYADSHKGFIIVFDRDILKATIQNKDAILIEVTYNGLPNVELTYTSNSIDFKNDASLLKSKLPEWSTEDEFRLIKKDDYVFDKDRRLEYRIKSILGILFGARMPDENIRTIDHILFAKDKSIEYYFARKNPKRDNIVFNSIKSRSKNTN